MNINFLHWVFLVIIFPSQVVQSQPNTRLTDQIHLQAEKLKVGRGLKLEQIQSNHLFGSPQSLQILHIGKRRKIDIVYQDSLLQPTSTFAQQHHALAAINGGFFNMKQGGSVTFLKVDDQMITEGYSESSAITQSVLAIDNRQDVFIGKSTNLTYYKQTIHFDDVLFTGPLLIDQGKILPQPATKFSTNRHPRTCICTKLNGKVLLITIDGRHERASGMSLSETAQLLLALNCYQGINLDGGGSTTMWIKGRGVVNHPSDNGIFDAKGERSVANAVIIR